MSRENASGGTGIGAALLATGVLAAFWATFAGVTAGAPAAWGVVAGAVVVVGVFSLGMSVTAAAATLSPALSLLVALLTYALQLVLLVVALTTIERSGALQADLDRAWLGGTVIAGTLVWSAALIRAAVRSTPVETPVESEMPLYHSSQDGRESSGHGEVEGPSEGETAG